MPTITEATFTPAQLATPTDLAAEEIDAIAEAVNRLVADAFALYVKTKNYHWHVYGSHFSEYHRLLDEHAEAILASVDLMAERVRRIGGTTIRSVAHVRRLQGIRDDDDALVTPEQMIARLIADNRHMAESQRRAIAVCDRNRDTATGNVLQELLDQTEKRIWFLHATSQGGPNVE